MNQVERGKIKISVAVNINYFEFIQGIRTKIWPRIWLLRKQGHKGSLRNQKEIN